MKRYLTILLIMFLFIAVWCIIALKLDWFDSTFWVSVLILGLPIGAVEVDYLTWRHEFYKTHRNGKEK